MSDYSPGPVQNGEILIRTLYSPFQINEKTGEVDPVHFRRDALERGLSVNRKPHITEEELGAKIEAKIERDIEEGKRRDRFYRVVTARCDDIRGLIGEDDRRFCCVYDTANREDISHADVCFAVDPPPRTANRKAAQKKMGNRLFEAFGRGKATDLTTVYAAYDYGPS